MAIGLGNIADYAKRETRGFDKLPFGPVDALVIAQLVYDSVPHTIPRLDDLTARYGTLRSRLRAFDPRHPIVSLRMLRRPPYDGATLAETNRLLHPGEANDHPVNDVSFADDDATHGFYTLAAQSPRFSGMVMSAFAERFDAEEQTQFAALTYRLPDKDGTLVIAFRGTDDSLVGWKEDFNMAFRYPVPSQVSAAEYLRDVAGLWQGPIILTGHSKGGNLAVYAAMNASDEVRRRIRRIYSMDGPGFPHDVVHGEAYARVRDRIEKIVPDSSIIGMILETPEPSTVVRSSAEGVMQHFAFSWQVDGDRFVRAGDLAHSSRLFNQSLNEWLAGLTQEQREHTVDALFSVLAASGADSFSQMMSGGLKSVADMIGRFVGLDADDKRNLYAAARLLLTAALSRNPGERRNQSRQDAAGDNATGNNITRNNAAGNTPTAR